MLNFPAYFNEGSTPQAGIDTVQLWIHPLLVNLPHLFHNTGNNNALVNLRYKQEVDYRTGNPIRKKFLVDIQAEMFHPEVDVYETILTILMQLAHDRILHFPQSDNFYDVGTFFKVNFDRLFALEKLDFYHDFRHGDIVFLGNPNARYPNTRYSTGSFKRPSILKAYSRPERLFQKRHLNHEVITGIKYPLRIEFALCGRNCKYLNILNLRGTYESVFSRYLPFLARKWLNYRHEVVQVRDLSYAPHLRKIVKTAGQRIPQYNNLHETPEKPIPYKCFGKKEVDINWVSEFYLSL